VLAVSGLRNFPLLPARGGVSDIANRLDAAVRYQEKNRTKKNRQPLYSKHGWTSGSGPREDKRVLVTAPLTMWN